MDIMPLTWARETSHLIAIDPGLQGTGLAIWRDGVLVEARVLDVPSKLRSWPWPARADFLADCVSAPLPDGARDRADCTVVCEYPEYFAGSKNMGWKSGDLQRLTYLVGLFSGRVAPARFVPVPVHTWKGQLPKHVVEERLIRRLGNAKALQLQPTLHAWDAIGIGMWARGEF